MGERERKKERETAREGGKEKERELLRSGIFQYGSQAGHSLWGMDC